MKIKKDFLNNRNFKIGTVSTVITIVFIIVVILINVLTSVLSERYQLSLDMTNNKLYRLSSQSIELIKNLEQEIEIIILNSEEGFRSGNTENPYEDASNREYYIQASNLINQYPKYSDKVKVRYIDLVKDPTIATQYSDDNVQINNIIIKNKDNHVVLLADDLFAQEASYQTYTYVITSSHAEQALSSAIMNITDPNKVKIAFITGFDEQGMDSINNLLKNNNYQIDDIAILTNSIPEDVKTVFIFAPVRDYDNESITKLKEFLENGQQNGKSIVYVASPEQGETPVLNGFLGEYGINVESGLVFETNANRLFSTNSPFYAIADYVSNEYNSSLGNTKVPVAMPLTKPVRVSELEGIDTNALLEFSSTSGIYPIDAGEDFEISEDLITGPITTAAIAQKSYESSKTSVVAIGTSVAFDSNLLARSSLNNSTYFMSLFNNISNRENRVVIESKSIAQQSLGISASVAITLGVVLTIVIPLTLVITGIVVWIRRRNK